MRNAQKHSKYGRSGIFWHCLLAVLLLAVIGNFFYMFHRLSQRAEREVEILGEIFVWVPAKQKSARNLQRWHDSSLIFYAVDSFQADNNGRLPTRWDDELLDSRSASLSDVDIQFQNADDRSLSEAVLPEEDHFHIWSGRICSENQPESYWENMEELTYDRILQSGSGSDFAIVYGAEKPDSDLEQDFAEYIRCLDSLGGSDSPDFILKRKEPL